MRWRIDLLASLHHLIRHLTATLLLFSFIRSVCFACFHLISLGFSSLMMGEARVDGTDG